MPLLLNLFIILIFRFNEYRFNIILLLTIIKCFILYWTGFMNLLISFIFINLWSNLNFFSFLYCNNKFYPLSWFMVMVVTLISSIVVLNSVDYLSIMDSYPFIFYIILFQLSMINFVLSHDIIAGFFYWDMLGLISYLLINFWSSKVNCGIKAVLYNKIGDNFFLFFVVIFYSFLSFISYYPELPYSIFSPFASLFFRSILFSSLFFSTLFSTSYYLLLFPIALCAIFYSKSAQLPFSTWLLNAINAPTPISSLLHSSTMVIAGVFVCNYWWYDNYHNWLFFFILTIFYFNTFRYIDMIFI